jgi:hypothetical protein
MEETRTPLNKEFICFILYLYFMNESNRFVYLETELW